MDIDIATYKQELAVAERAFDAKLGKYSKEELITLAHELPVSDDTKLVVLDLIDGEYEHNAFAGMARTTSIAGNLRIESLRADKR